MRKTVIAVLLMFGLAGAARATTCGDIPINDALHFDSCGQNIDGSTYFSHPRLVYNGTEGYLDVSLASYFCAYAVPTNPHAASVAGYQLKGVDNVTVFKLRPEENVIQQFVPSGTYNVLDTLACRIPQPSSLAMLCPSAVNTADGILYVYLRDSMGHPLSDAAVRANVGPDCDAHCGLTDANGKATCYFSCAQNGVKTATAQPVGCFAEPIALSGSCSF